jgi:hypothetical protein
MFKEPITCNGALSVWDIPADIEEKIKRHLFDKNGIFIPNSSIIFDGKEYFCIYWDAGRKRVDAFAPTSGYIHDIQQAHLTHFELIGPYEDNKHLLEI